MKIFVRVSPVGGGVFGVSRQDHFFGSRVTCMCEVKSSAAQHALSEIALRANLKSGKLLRSVKVPMQASSQLETMPHPHLVLCIDDELIGLKVRRLLLERAGYTVLSALEGTEGLAIFAREPVHAVVLDFAMPGMNGAEVAARMRELKPDVPILLLSAYLGLPQEVTSLVNVYMTKGEGAPVLLDKLDAMLSASSFNERSSSSKRNVH